MIKLVHYSDASHGWLKVKRSVVAMLGLLDKVSIYSFQSKSGTTVYLEEDGDATLLINALKAKGLAYEILDVDNGDRSRIRSLPRFSFETALYEIFVEGQLHAGNLNKASAESMRSKFEAEGWNVTVLKVTQTVLGPMAVKAY